MLRESIAYQEMNWIHLQSNKKEQENAFDESIHLPPADHVLGQGSENRKSRFCPLSLLQTGSRFQKNSSPHFQGHWWPRRTESDLLGALDR